MAAIRLHFNLELRLANNAVSVKKPVTNYIEKAQIVLIKDTGNK